MNRIILILFLSLFARPVFSQDGELPEEQILIQKDRKIVLPERPGPEEKINLNLKPLPKAAQKFTYRDFGINLPPVDPRIQSPVFYPAPEARVKQGFVRLAAGNYGSSELDAWYNSGRQKDFAYGLNLRHMASANGPVANSGFSNNALGANCIYFTPSFTLDGNLRYNRDRYNFYGYDQEKSPNRKADSTRQLFHSVWFRLNLNAREKEKAKLHWKGGLSIGNLSDAFRASESEVLLDAAGRYRLSDSSSLNLFTDFSLLKRSDSVDQNRALWRLQPEYKFRIRGFRIDAGFQLSLVSEPILQKNNSFLNESSFHIHPRLNMELALAEEKLKAFAGISGGMNRNSLRSHVEQNPFLMADVYLRHENQLLSIFLGFRGAHKGILQYHSKFAFDKINHLAFYQNTDTLVREKFRIVYDSGATRRVTWETEAVYDPGKGSRAGIRFVYHGYNLSGPGEAWHLPRTRATVFGSLPLAENLSLAAEFFYIGGVRARNPRSLLTEKLPGIADLNLKCEYRFKTNFSAFLSLHNILNNKNPRFLYYPGQGFRLMVGGSALF